MNYDFLTVEEVNNIVLELAQGLRDDYILPFNTLNGLTEGISYVIDGFIYAKNKGNNVYDVTVFNQLFTGAFCLQDCTNSSYTIIDSDYAHHLLNLQLTVDSEDLTDGCLVFHIANVPFNTHISEEYYFITGETSIATFKGENAEFNLLITDKNGELYNGEVTIVRDDISVTDGVLNYIYHNVTSTQELFLKIGGYYTLLKIKCVKQNIVYDIDTTNSQVYQSIRNGKLVINTLPSVNGTLIYNGKTATATSNNQGVLTFSDLDLSSHENTELDCKIELTGTYLNPYSDKFTMDTPILSGDLQELHRTTSRPTVYNLTGKGTGYDDIYVREDCIINYIGDGEDEPLRISVFEETAVTLNNYKGKLRIQENQGTLILNDSIITGTYEQSGYGTGKIIANNCEFNVEQWKVQGKLTLNNCVIKKQEETIKPLFAINNEVTFNNCKFIAEFNCSNKDDIYLFEINENATVNNIQGILLKNNNFPLNNNKSDINITLQETGHTTNYQGVNGVLWTVTGTGETYTQNITITEE